MLNKIMLIGHVGTNPQLKKTNKNNISLCTFRLATSEKIKGYNGELYTKTEWHNLICWGKKAEILEKHVKKGKFLYVEGKMQTRVSENEKGKRNFYPEVVIDKIKFLPFKKKPYVINNSEDNIWKKDNPDTNNSLVSEEIEESYSLSQE